MDKDEAARSIIAAALPQVPFEGWHMGLLREAAREAGYEASDIARVFPGGTAEAVEWFLKEADRAMLARAEQYHFETMRVRDRIATCVRVRLEYYQPHREAVRKTVAYLSFHPLLGITSLSRTMDAMWRAAGDASSDVSWYSKRLLLGAVYTGTLMAWLDDQSPGQNETWLFLERRLDDVMRLGKKRRAVEETLHGFFKGLRKSS